MKFRKARPFVALAVLFSVMIAAAPAAIAGTTHTEGGLVNNASDGTASNGSPWRVFKTSDTTDVVTGVVGTPTSGYWRGDVGAALVNQWLVGDDHICIIDKETNSGTPSRKGYYAVINKNLTSSDPDQFSPTTLRQIPVPVPTPSGPVIALTWEAAVSDPGSPVVNNISKYQIYRSTDPSGPFTLIGTAEGATNYTDSTAVTGVTYYYAIRLVYRVASGNPLTSLYLSAASDAATSSDTMPPAPPTGLVVTDPGTGNSLNLAWVAPTTNQDGTPLIDLAGYNIYRSLTAGGPYTKINASIVTGETYTSTGLTLGTTYYYVVRAVDNSANESANSNEDSGMPTLFIGIDLYEFNEGIIYYQSGANPDEIAVSFNQDLSDRVQGISSGQLLYSHTGNPGKWGGYLGGILPVNLSLSTANGVSFWLKGDGSSNNIRVDLKESNVAPANGEVYSSRDIPLSNTSWHKVEIPFYQFTRNPYDGITGGNNVFDKNIAQYQLVYTGLNASAAYHRMDNLIATGNIDDTPPVIVHTPVTSPKPENQPVSVVATITDNTAVAGAKVFYRLSGTSAYASVEMTASGNTYTGIIPGASVRTPGVDYYIWAYDNNFNQATHPASNAVTNPHSFTVTDSTRPEILWVHPPDGSVNVPLRTAITAKFSEQMDQTTVNNAFSISPSVPGVLSWVDDAITFTPSQGLAQNTVYTVTITNMAADMAGNTMLNTYVWSFTTGNGTIDDQRPTILSVDPPNGATDVPLMPSIAVTFSEAMDRQETEWAFSIWPNVAGTKSWIGNTMFFTPTTNLSPNTVYSVTVGTGARDLAGNTMLNAYSWSFTTGTSSDNTAPVVTASTPMGTGVWINSRISVTFSELMDMTTINSGTFTISPAVPGTFVWENNKVNYVTANLDLNRSYTVTVSTGVRDAAGNAMGKPYSWTFVTGDYIGIDLYEGTEQITYYDGQNDGTAIGNDDHGYDIITKHDGAQGKRVQYSYPGTGWGGYWGGTLPINLDISTFNGVKFWLKGDGTGNTIRLTFDESNVSGADGETWRGPDIPLNDTNWKLIEIPYTQFTRDPYAYQGNGVFNKTIKGYTMVYIGTNTSGANHYVDTLIAADISDVVPPSTVEGIAMSKSGSNLTLIWAPATDNVGVVGYNIYRGTAATFTTAAQNKIGTSLTTSYVDAGALSAADSYYYKVTAVDAVGNESIEPSNVGYKLNWNMTFHTSISNINWISIPAITPYKKAADIAADIPNCTKVSRFNPDTQLYENWENFFGWSGTNFDVVTGESYAVIVNANSPARLVGWYKPYTVNMTFHTTISNINWVSLPYNSAYSRASNIVPAVANVSKLSRFNPDTQLYENWEDFFGWSGTDFSVVPGEGYAVIIRGNSSFSPSAVD